MIRSQPVATVACPSCDTDFPIDPAKIPDEGVHTICSNCRRVFRVELDGLDLDAPEAPPESPGAYDELIDTASTLDAGMDLDLVEEEDEEIPTPRPDEVADTPAETEAETEPEIAAEPEPELEPASPPDETFEDLRSLATEAMLEPDDADGEFQVEESTLVRGRDRFGQRDPHERAKRLARVLVSDILAYHPTRYHESFARGTLKEDFEEEVEKSRKEYVDQVGEDLAASTPYFDQALNEILAKGESVF